MLFRYRSFLARLFRFMDRPWYLALVAALAFFDLFCGVIPIEVFLVSAVVVKPRRWGWAFLLTTSGSALGALFLGALVQWDSSWIMNHLFSSLSRSQSWVQMTEFVSRYGALALGSIAVSPFPQQPAVAIAALSKMPLPVLFVSVWAGRAIKYGFFAWAGSHAPGLVSRWQKPVEEKKAA